MTTTPFNKEAYGKLLLEVLPTPITNDEELDRVQEILEPLYFNDGRAPEETALCNLLTILITSYEAKAYPIEVYPHEILKDIVDSSGTSLQELSHILGGAGTIVTLDILNGEVGITKAQATLLGAHFKVSPRLFI